MLAKAASTISIGKKRSPPRVLREEVLAADSQETVPPDGHDDDDDCKLLSAPPAKRTRRLPASFVPPPPPPALALLDSPPPLEADTAAAVVTTTTVYRWLSPPYIPSIPHKTLPPSTHAQATAPVAAPAPAVAPVAAAAVSVPINVSPTKARVVRRLPLKMTVLPTVHIPAPTTAASASPPRPAPAPIRRPNAAAMRETLSAVNSAAGVQRFWKAVDNHICLQEAVDYIANPTPRFGGRITDPHSDHIDEQEYRAHIKNPHNAAEFDISAALANGPAVAHMRQCTAFAIRQAGHAGTAPTSFDEQDLSNLYLIHRDILMPAMVKAVTDSDARVSALQSRVAELEAQLKRPRA